MVNRRCTLDIPLDKSKKGLSYLQNAEKRLRELGVIFPSAPVTVRWDLSNLKGAEINCRKDDDCQLKIPVEGERRMDQVRVVETLLGKLGVSFDTGTDYNTRDWELDDSLEGATLRCPKTKKEES